MKLHILLFTILSLAVTSCAAQVITTPSVPVPMPRSHPDTLNHCEFKYTPSKTIEWYTSQMTEEQLPEYFNIHILVFTDVNGNKVIINSLDIQNYNCVQTQVP